MVLLVRFSSRLNTLLLFGFLITAIAGCQSNKVIVDYDTDTDFSKFHFYQLLEERSDASEEIEPLLEERTKMALQAELVKSAFAPATVTQPADILVRYYVSSQTQNQESKSSSSIGFGGGSSGASMGISLSFPLGGNEIVKDIQIIIDLLNSNDNKLKWRGIKNFKLSNESPAEITAIINAAIAEIFSHYPPDAASK